MVISTSYGQFLGKNIHVSQTEFLTEEKLVNLITGHFRANYLTWLKKKAVNLVKEEFRFVPLDPKLYKQLKEYPKSCFSFPTKSS